jgi:hypothetical protein
VTFIQAPAPAASASATSLGLAFGSSNAAGNFLLACVRIGALGRTVTITDSNNTWSATPVVTQQQTTDGHQAYIFALPNCAAGANTVTVGISGAAASIRFSILEYSGVSSAGTTDGTPASAQAATTTAAASGTSATSNGADLLLGCVTGTGGSTLSAEAFAGSPGGSVTVRQSISTYLYVFDTVNPGTTGSYGATGTWNVNTNWTASFAAFLPATAGGTGLKIPNNQGGM